MLVKSDLRDVPTAIRLSRNVLRNIKENLFWAFFYNCVGIPLAAGVFYNWLGPAAQSYVRRGGNVLQQRIRGFQCAAHPFL